MTPKERVFARLHSKPVDKIPNLNIVMAFAAKEVNASYKQFAQDYRILTESNVICCENFGIDMVSAISDPMREAFDFGAEIVFPEHGVPYSPNPFIREYDDTKKLKTIDPQNGVRMRDRIHAIEWYKSNVGMKYPILGWVEGPVAEAADLRGMDRLFLDFYDNEGFVKDLMDICTEQAIAFAQTQVKAGADFIGIGDAAASLVGPTIYRNYVLPREKHIIDEVHCMGAFVKLHICGNISPIIPELAASNADIVDVDWMVDFRKAIQLLGNTAACGNFDPVAIMLQGSTENVFDAVKQCLEVSAPNTFIAAGCEIPANTPEVNMIAVSRALEGKHR